MPTMGVALLFSLPTYLTYTISDEAKLLIYATLFLNTALIPAFLSYSLVRFGSIKSLNMTERAERNLPFMLTVFFYFFSYYMLHEYAFAQPLYDVLLGATFALILAFIINLKWKISIHAIGIGGIIGALLAASQLFAISITPFLIPVLLVAGLVGFSRLTLNAHNQAQVYAGFVLGFICQYIFMLLQIG